ncbi:MULTISPECIES: polyprenyl synthetase family protein [Lysinibacillus]|jgi:geranylgeranyl diphosphate synthase type II|uniref:polyprenyl synthetase family protein n=1 Tax=Lysinibacillus TaxID=400634 RepID=UPI000469AB52|nr:MULTISPECIES: farnesyl diphosphate synthase [Lysinibacillus]AJK87276.1 farnesyl-diphosphate synthase [Lysinibacillus fusiformis]KAB0443654.1 polyprenyl synthetase family protein [Lysinibacillus fusiformis]KEK12355.1 farnesyl-diphosphate synthase [Lysinibacillus sphaericus]KGA81025.1 farnesyl-diphosphate synthase [Lysinibacillus fusiformis]KHK53316.1 farnesyl-diphosphate synthase [Lysinibacillus sp. A1]
MNEPLKYFIESNIPQIEETMFALVSKIDAPVDLKDSMLYSLKAGGKRIRPLFVLAVLELYQKNLQDGLIVGSVIEIIHTYSLIHDDLPSMDNDDFRRGKPTNHKVYGEALATLAGDALNTLAFGILARMEVTAEKRIELVQLLSVAAGAEGMVGGQVLDMEGEQRQLNLTELEQVHVNKTGALLRFSIEAGAVLADASKQDRATLKEYAHHIGLAFQIQDDILDIEGTTEELGKTAGKDVASDKSTYPALLTLNGAKEKLAEHYQHAINALDQLPIDASLLRDFAAYIVHRKN